jgi:hypothetical protein
MDHVHLGSILNSSAARWAALPWPADAKVGRAAWLWRFDQLLERMCRQIGIDHQHVGLRSKQRDRGKVRVANEVALLGAGRSPDAVLPNSSV